MHLPAINFPNGYPGASPAFAPYTQFDSAGNVTGGFGTESLLTDRSHSSYHALQTSLQGNVTRAGPLIQVSFTWSKSLDDTSSVIGGFISGASGATAPAWPEDPLDTRADKGPSTFDVSLGFSASVIQDLHAERLSYLQGLNRKITAGWQILSVSTLSSGLPFTIYSGVQQTGVGSNGVDRPDQIGTPVYPLAGPSGRITLDWARTMARSFRFRSGFRWHRPTNQGVFGTLGRDTFRGPDFHNFDFALIKDTPFGTRGGGESMNLQFRAEFFNLFNNREFWTAGEHPEGTGFGEISRTAGNSRQIQFSVKLIF